MEIIVSNPILPGRCAGSRYIPPRINIQGYSLNLCFYLHGTCRNDKLPSPINDNPRRFEIARVAGFQAFKGHSNLRRAYAKAIKTQAYYPTGQVQQR
jgi:hypothetical protein